MSAARFVRHATVVAAAVLLAACASRPARDGAPARVPGDLSNTPDAQPRVEPLRRGGPNKPYEVLGRRYVPMAADEPYSERGLASWYGTAFHGKSTSSGEPYDMYAMSAAHKTMPLPSYAVVRNPANGREVVVRVNDRGPFVAGRVIDLSYTAALRLGLLAGVAPVEVRRLTHDEIRAGLWRRGAPQPEAAPQPAPVLAAAAPDAADPLMALVAAADARAPARSATAPAGATTAAAAPGFWLQLGAFRQPEGAATLRRQVLDAAGDLAVAVFDDVFAYRVQVGPYASRGEAQAAGERLRSLLLIAPLLVERRP
ncbi:septal ring lytic transglycosylase RlpA family protein [Rubrivivax gelatinosus]|uniref:Endolytic peptidoglycan transglycosylase RlpA n=2 Tax=Rubrivivax gelatinosus TaxID=28068 RepID=A0ABS1DRW3_RUBGE|nr:septal ring lytic transglycosylase RlpA family protein [Rubrivivax gelatinosus]MBK1712330.1 septal ring lytic transglycosylase RlpA family lipoprotein [Rubrivivax gelatinosus]